MNDNLIQALKQQDKIRDDFIERAKTRYIKFAYDDSMFRDRFSMEQYVNYCLQTPLDVITAYSLVKG